MDNAPQFESFAESTYESRALICSEPVLEGSTVDEAGLSNSILSTLPLQGYRVLNAQPLTRLPAIKVRSDLTTST